MGQLVYCGREIGKVRMFTSHVCFLVLSFFVGVLLIFKPQRVFPFTTFFSLLFFFLVVLHIFNKCVKFHVTVKCFLLEIL